MKIGVLYNTINSTNSKEVEDDIEKTARIIKKSLKKENHETVFINADKNIFENIKKNNIEFIFNLCERFENNCLFEPHVAALLELSKVPFSGSKHSTLALCSDKVRSKEILKAHKIPSPKFQAFYTGEEEISPELKFPLIIKPKQQENSIGITKESIVNNKEELRRKTKEIIKKFSQEAIAEEFIAGKEIEISIIGNSPSHTILPPAKVHYQNLKEVPEEKIFCYNSKWNKDSEEYGDYKKAEISGELEKELKKIALKTYNIFKIKDYGRIDFRVTKENIPYVIEVTANPGMSEVCSTPKAGKWHGMDYDCLIKNILNESLKRQNN